MVMACLVLTAALAIPGASTDGECAAEDAPPAVVRRGAQVERQNATRSAFLHAWRSYATYAWGQDEVNPVSRLAVSSFGMGLTLVDSLDTMHLMGLSEEFAAAVAWVRTRLRFGEQEEINVFEVTIRVLGGLLSAYELSGERSVLDAADELGQRLVFAFDSPTGLPYGTVGLKSRKRYNPTWSRGASTVAEVATLQVEFRALSRHTRKPVYEAVAQRVMAHLREMSRPSALPRGLYPTMISPVSGEFASSDLTLGARADSAYEYLLKQWLLTQRTEPYLRTMFDEAMLGMARSMVARSTPSELVYIADYVSEGKLVHKMDHLACFAGGMLAVGAQHGGEFDREYMTLAERIGETCYEFYRRTTSGLSPEFMSFVGGSDPKVPRNAAYNIGRPEAVETFFIMWYYTRDPKWREMGWEVFSSFERHARTPSGWAALKDVNNPAKLDDKMESFVLAETMKYLFLLFDSSYPIPLDKYVFNTEAHPLGTFDASAFTSAAPPKRR